MRRSAFLLFFLVLLSVAIGHSQVVESADGRGLTIHVGGMASGFDPGANGSYSPGNNKLIGAGTYVDVHFSHWVQLEGEARWLYWNQYYGEHQSNYLAGPRVPIKRFGRWNTYGKALIGVGKFKFPYGFGNETVTSFAFGGTLDYRLSRKLTIRAADFEYQK